MKCPSCNASFLIEREYIPTKEKKLRNGISASIAVLVVVSILLGFVLYDQRIEKIEKQRQVAVERHVNQKSNEWIESNWSPDESFRSVSFSVGRLASSLDYLIQTAETHTNWEVDTLFSSLSGDIEESHSDAENYLYRNKSNLSTDQQRKVASIVSNLADAKTNHQKAKNSSSRDFRVYFGRMKSDINYAAGVVEDFNEELNTPPTPSQELVKSWEAEAIDEFNTNR